MKHKIYSHYKKIVADVYTPINIYTTLRDIFPNTLLLESADYHDRTDSKSFIAIEPIANFQAKGKKYQYNFPEKTTVTGTVNNYKEIRLLFEEFITSFKTTTTNLPFNIQGFWGYSSFEAVQYMEDIHLNYPKTELKNIPDLKYQFFRYVLVFDHFKNELFIVHFEIGKEIKDDTKINTILSLLPSNKTTLFKFYIEGEESSNLTDNAYKKLVEKGIEHCKIGNTFQVVLSREFQQKYKGDDFNLYRSLRSINPSPYLFYFDYGDFKIFGSSPESQLQVQNNTAYINPIAGTVLRGDNSQEDAQRAAALQQNPKEISEHVMLVDLARNDLSKNAKKVHVETYAEIQYFSHVIHMVSKVKGECHTNKNGRTIYADTFPAGTLSGAPKYKALQIIAENEPNTRSFYGGAIGFFGVNGSVNHAIIIRSFLCKNNTLIYQAGAGIVSESTPKGELQEVNNKIAALRKAIQKASTL